VRNSRKKKNNDVSKISKKYGQCFKQSRAACNNDEARNSGQRFACTRERCGLVIRQREGGCARERSINSPTGVLKRLQQSNSDVRGGELAIEDLEGALIHCVRAGRRRGGIKSVSRLLLSPAVSWQGWQMLPSNGSELKMAIIIKLGSWGSPRKRKDISHNG
jgi:hypothetical protein